MARGRKSLPENQKKLQGTSQPCRMKDELQVDTVTELLQFESVTKSKILHTARARHIFVDRANALIAMKILTEADYDQLAVYSNTLELYEKASRSIAKDGLFITSTNVIIDSDGNKTEEEIINVNPYTKHYKGLIELINKLGSEFGFSPVARTKIQKTTTGEQDELAAALKQFDE